MSSTTKSLKTRRNSVKDLKEFEPLDNETEELVTNIVDCGFTVYTTLGPGLLESVYETCLCYELQKRNIRCERQVTVPIVYDGIQLSDGLRIDIFVERKVVVELKAVEETLSLYTAQVITYLKLTRTRIGLLINFNVPTFKGAVKRIII